MNELPRENFKEVVSSLHSLCASQHPLVSMALSLVLTLANRDDGSYAHVVQNQLNRTLRVIKLCAIFY